MAKRETLSVWTLGLLDDTRLHLPYEHGTGFPPNPARPPEKNQHHANLMYEESKRDRPVNRSFRFVVPIAVGEIHYPEFSQNGGSLGMTTQVPTRVFHVAWDAFQASRTTM